MRKVSFSKAQWAKAKELDRPLVCIAYDGRHVTKGSPGRSSELTWTGPLPGHLLVKVQDFLASLWREMYAENGSVAGIEQKTTANAAQREAYNAANKDGRLGPMAPPPNVPRGFA